MYGLDLVLSTLKTENQTKSLLQKRFRPIKMYNLSWVFLSWVDQLWGMPQRRMLLLQCMGIVVEGGGIRRSERTLNNGDGLLW